jgi:hypothetical protein
MSTEQQGQHGSQGQDHPGQKPFTPGKTEGNPSPQPGKDKGTPPRTPDKTGGPQGGNQQR